MYKPKVMRHAPRRTELIKEQYLDKVKVEWSRD